MSGAPAPPRARRPRGGQDIADLVRHGLRLGRGAYEVVDRLFPRIITGAVTGASPYTLYCVSRSYHRWGARTHACSP